MSLPAIPMLLALSIGLLAVNQLIYRLEVFTRIMALYWAMQAINATAIVALLAGVFTTSGFGRLINGVLILSLSMHVVQNHSALLNRRSAERREELEKERAELEIRRDEMRKRVATAARSPASSEVAATEEAPDREGAPTDPG